MSEEENYTNYVQRVYESTSNDELASNYDAWASTYDYDTIENWGRQDPNVGVDVFSRYVNTQASILDAGAGTGIVGSLLSEKGYQNINRLLINLKYMCQLFIKSLGQDINRFRN